MTRDLSQAAAQLRIGRIQQRQEMLERRRTVLGDGLCLLLDCSRIGSPAQLSECLFQCPALKQAGEHFGFSAHMGRL